ncbi:DNA replication complex GINS protein [Heracleum sosnowskyi]|uniref:DNA replication complex GINS protein n=1 Tax=Heracleum sosnowskyi TaxID=360622 RepID=A0AAD8JA20_9APIA|nr:DNA replication complex GINS protein [Heracleum sosnowskyi]
MSDSSSAAATSYIHTVQHLIEECILFNMTKEECMDALAKHANILPVITSTVWKELEKENKQFFEAYSMNMEEIRGLIKEKSAVTDYELEMMKQRIHKMLSDLNSTANGSTC